MHMKGALKGAALGAALAAVATLLLAPKSGKKARTDLKKLLDTASHDLAKKAKSIQHLSRAQYEELFLNSLAHAAKKKEDVAVVIDDVTQVLKKGWEDIRKELKAATQQKKTSGKKKR